LGWGKGGGMVRGFNGWQQQRRAGPEAAAGDAASCKKGREGSGRGGPDGFISSKQAQTHLPTPTPPPSPPPHQSACRSGNLTFLGVATIGHVGTIALSTWLRGL
jgi:hypothetical protein